MTPISFKANYIHPVEIQKYNGVEYQPCNAAFIELENREASVVKNVNIKWKSKLVDGIYNSFITEPELKRVFAVTTQADSFEKLDPDKILGMALYEKYNKTYLYPEIKFFQVDPKNLSTKYGNTILKKIKNYFFKFLHRDKPPKEKPQYQHIGESIMRSIQKLYSDETIALFALPKAEGFYKKMGFYKSGMFMIWRSK